MNSSERFAAAAKHILDEDRRADRERIAELERDLAALRAHSIAVAADLTRQLDEKAARMATWMVAEDDSTVQRLNKQLDELTEKCAALVLENKRLREDDEPERKPLDVAVMNRVLDAAGVPPVKQEPTLRIDTDMSDPQPGKLLVVRLDGEDSYKMQEGQAPYLARDQFVGFLVETPAVKRTPKVGDRVRIIKQGFNFIPAWGQVGEVGTVRSVDCDSVWLDGVGTGGPWCHDINNLEVIE